jgi:phosphatidate cytidylyltransferase
MKTRVISAIIALLIFIPILMNGGLIFTLAIYVLSLLGLKEFIDIKETKKSLPDFVKFISFVAITFLIFGLNDITSSMSISLPIISFIFLGLLIPLVYYHDKEKYSVNDAFFLIGSVFFLGVSFKLFILIRNKSLLLFLYLFLVTSITDTYAYITGMLIGKNKLLENISPKKTVEGLIGGTLFGTLFGSIFYLTLINPNIEIFHIYIITFFLSILAQQGDLVFSAIKRYYDKKDFSNIMPGHGGVLDRLDSLIFALIGSLIFIGIL